MPEWEPPESFDGFEIKGQLGRGGMGRVYLAYEVSLDRPVALKLIAADSPDDSARLRFSREARAIARLQHPNIVAIYRIGEVEGRPYIAYEYVDGDSLDRVATPLPWTRVAEIGLSAARGLGLAHQRGVLHRDVKPANVILAREGSVKLVDFGLAKLFAEPVFETEPRRTPSSWEQAFATADTTRIGSGVRAAMNDGSTWRGEHTGAMIGTPNYIAPEVWMGERSSTRTDVYALGLVIYELCTGTQPFAGLSGRALIDQITQRPLSPLASLRSDLPRSFAAVVDKATARDPADRYADGAELARALETVESVLRGFRTVGDRTHGGDDASIVAASLSRIQGDADELMDAFYDRLFARTPELRALFPASMIDQKMMLAAALRLVVDHLRNPAKLVPVLEDLGWRHARYGAKPEHLRLFGEALLETVRQFDRVEWNAAIGAAWKRAFAAIAEAMLRGMALHVEKKRA